MGKPKQKERAKEIAKESVSLMVTVMENDYYLARAMQTD